MPADSNALSWTSADVLSDVRRRASLPTTSTDWTDAVLLREATDVLWSFGAWALAQAGEGRLLASIDRAPATFIGSLYRAASEVTLPPLAVADTIEGVTHIDVNGRIQTRLQRIDPMDEAQFDTVDSEGTPAAYSLIGGRIRLYPKPTTGGTIRIHYQRRHGELVADTAANVGTITSTSGTTTTVLTMGGAITGLAAGEVVDIIDQAYPHRSLVTGLEVTNVATNVLTVASPASLLSALPMTGTRVVRAGRTPYVSLPMEMRGCFTEKIAAHVLRALGDMAGSQASETAAVMEMSRVLAMLTPRTKRDKPRAMNPSSLMRSRMRRW